jgi:hypothetical protein
MISSSGDLLKVCGENRRAKPQQALDTAIAFVRRPEKVV